jgi:hypothetical protein
MMADMNTWVVTQERRAVLAALRELHATVGDWVVDAAEENLQRDVLQQINTMIIERSK